MPLPLMQNVSETLISCPLRNVGETLLFFKTHGVINSSCIHFIVRHLISVTLNAKIQKIADIYLHSFVQRTNVEYHIT
jgi:hypothetical protein